MSHTLLVDIWKSLRRPFILPEQSIRLHKCEYETIDMGVLGCCICATIHICDFSTCQNVIDTNDGKVCCLSGIVVYPKKYAENEYMDTLTLSDNIPEFCDYYEDLVATVNSMLVSALAMRTRRHLMCVNLLRLRTLVQNSNNVVTSCSAWLKSMQTNSYLCDFVSIQRREKLKKSAIDACSQAISLMLNTGMTFKSPEVKKITVGLLYLMRSGVFIKQSVILKQLVDMQKVLPPENILLKSYGIHPKFITETENRLKFSLRLQLQKQNI